MGNIIAIVGRPNVGKSTLFNRLVQQRKAIVDDTSGVTRDRHYGVSDWNGKNFVIIDTGGFVPGSDDVLESAIREQVELAMEEAEVILFMVDVTCGITDLDNQMASILRKSTKPAILVVNKVDNAQRGYDANEFYGLGFDHFFSISSINGSGTGELLDEMVTFIEPQKEDAQDDIPRMAIIGQPNVGKSTLLNALVGKQQNIVTDIAGTTRDTIHTKYKLFNKNFILLDTAGLRKKSKVHENLEFYSVMRAIKAIEESDVCMLLVDSSIGVTAQDVNIFRLAQRRKKGIVILVNKWDLMEKDTDTAKLIEEEILAKIEPFTDVPVVFISALHKTRIFKGIELAAEVAKKRKVKIPASKLNKELLKKIEETPPPSHRGKYIKIKYVSQLPSATPSFAFFCNHPQYIKESYKNFLENKLRESYDLAGVPISILFRKK